MMTQTGVRYPLKNMNTDRSDKKGTHWWSFLDLHPKKKSFYLTVLVLRDSKNFYCKTLEKRYIRYSMELRNLKKKIRR